MSVFCCGSSSLPSLMREEAQMVNPMIRRVILKHQTLAEAVAGYIPDPSWTSWGILFKFI